MFKRMKKKSAKLVVIGLDCASPELIFHRWRNELTNLNRLMSRGVYGNLESCTPCITVPAWSVMTSGKDPVFWAYMVSAIALVIHMSR